MVSLADMFPDLEDWTKLGLPSNHDPAISGIVPQSGSLSISVHNGFINKVVATGPYVLVKSDEEETILERNENYWDDFPENGIFKVIFRNTRDLDTRVLKIMAVQI